MTGTRMKNNNVENCIFTHILLITMYNLPTEHTFPLTTYQQAK
jgi:hypothetical protein